MEYFDNPPAFSFIFSQHDRLWGLSAGELKATDYRTANRLYVYYTDVANSENAWFNATTQEVGFINMEDKHGVFDEFVGISAIDGFMLFHGRNRMQVWSGIDPTSGGNFSWSKTMKVPRS